MRRLLTGAAVLLVLATGCTDDSEPDDSVGQSRVDVDTPELRALKQEVGVEACVPGGGADGGLPDLTLACLGGGPDVDLATLEGPLIVNFWNAACGPCRQEMPAIQEFHERYAARVPVVGVTNDLWPEQAFELARTTGATYPQLADPGNDVQGTEIRPRGYPAFAFLTSDGDVEMVLGGIDSVDELVELAEDNLGITL
ncbi:TlpA disulfide reductase family protein [Nocardioides sp. W7]|uniref:TlpA family protein disulfide reductase n=1 Tax=Nocardioides sp. W7 TaxID=2931390 RepID=UPI001FD594B6|nr:TlpA disulfide reductase family protein [Nocardioides sp. W7]